MVPVALRLRTLPWWFHPIGLASERSGNTITPNTVTGKQVKESTLGTVPSATKATSLPRLAWHTIATFDNGWKNIGTAFNRSAAYAIDAQGVVHLRGEIDGGAVDSEAFELPAKASPPGAVDVLVPIVINNGTGYLSIHGGAVDVKTADSGSPATFTSLEGVSFDTR